MRVLQGNISQASNCFSAESKNAQCTAIAAAACCALLVKGPAGWTSEIIDEIVRVGDQLYRDSWNRLPLSPSLRPKYLNPDELLRKAPFTPSVPYSVDLTGTVTGALKLTREIDFELPTLEDGLFEIFRRHQAAILVTSGYSVAVFKRDKVFLYDSHSRNQLGLPDANGKAVFIEFACVRELVEHIHQLYGVTGEYFELTGVSVNRPASRELDIRSTKTAETTGLGIEDTAPPAKKRYLNPKEKARLQREKDRVRIASRRQDEEYRNAEAIKDRQRNAIKRKADQDSAAANPEYSELLRQDVDDRCNKKRQDAERKRKKRLQDKNFVENERLRNSQYYENRRKTDPDSYQKMNEADANRKRVKRAAEDFPAKEYSRMKKEYQKRIQEGPTLVCASCGQLFFKNGIVSISSEKLSEVCSYKDWREVCKLKDPVSDCFILCRTCLNYLKKGVLPPLALINGMEFPPIPEELKNLSPLEERFVSPRLPFMQIRELGVGRQFGLRGSCINVCVEVDSSVSILPRLPEGTNTIHVQIMRRMSDQHPYAFEKVRPEVVLRATRYLVGTDMYKKHGITLSEKVMKTLLELTQNKDGSSDMLANQCLSRNLENNITEATRADRRDDNIGDEENLNELTEEEALLLQQETFLDDIFVPDTGLKIAPGEGKTPTSLLFDEDVQELSFPTIYCGELRPIRSKVSMSQITKAEARMHDRRCALNAPHMFLTFARLRRQRLASAISTAVRKKRRRRHLTVSDVLNNATLGELIQHNDGYQVLQVDRSSPAYWEKKKKHVLAMCRQFGMPTFFLSLSCAETRWKELLVILKKTVDKELISVEEATTIPWQEKVRLIQADSHTIVRYFSRRIAELLKLLQSKGGPFKKYRITHFVIRFEFQHRGSVHVHMIVWLDGAPLYFEFDIESAQECADFIDEFVTCKEDKSLGDLMSVQYHRHNRTCHKQIRGHQICRFGVPWPPMRATAILLPLDDSFGQEDRKRLKDEYKSMIKVLISVFKTREIVTFDEFLNKLKWTEEEYILRIRSTLLQPTTFLRRDVHEMKLNGCNKQILELHDANMDIQFITGAYACVSYVVDYTTKSSRGVSKLLKETADKVRAGNAPVTEQLRAVSNVFVNKSEVSAQEAAFHNLSLPLCITSDAEIYINTAPPEERTRIIKSTKELQEICAVDSQSIDILVSGLLEHYQLRPDEIEDCCLADFAAWYNFSKTKSQNRNVKDDGECNDDFQDIDNITETNISDGNKFLKLKDNSGIVKRRTKPKVIRYRHYSAAHDPDNYEREHVMLFTAWRDESELTKNTHSLYIAALETIEKNKTPYDKLVVDLNEILQKIMENAEAEEELEKEDRGPPAEFAVYEQPEGQADIGQDLAPDVLNAVSRPSERFLLPKHQPHDDDLADVARLNERQRRYHLNLIHILKTNGNMPVRHFVSGGAGVGKSKLISVITQSSIRIFIEQGALPDALTVLLMAPTGKAAFNIAGVTLHSALHIFGQNEEMSLNAEELNSMRSQLRHLKLIIIDEISMVGRKMLNIINTRLQQIFGTRQQLGGISVIAFGDFNQLAPVGDSWIFASAMGDLGVLAGASIWNQFKLYLLTEIMRQKDDAHMAEALNRLAVGGSNEQDDVMFRSREVTTLAKEGIYAPDDAVELFETNAQAEVHNTLYLNRLGTESFESTAMDYCEGEGTAAMKAKQIEKIQNWPLNKTQNLPRHLTAKLTARYMLTVNVKTLDGLTNGACGTLRHIVWGVTGDGKRTAIRLYVEFDDEIVGKQTRNDNRDVMIRDGTHFRKWTPIERAFRPIIPSKGSPFKIIRKQFPMVPAKGITIHKSQGSTFKSIVVHMRTQKMDRRSMYVAFSRVTSLSGLYIDGKYKRPTKPNRCDPVVNEMIRLKSPENLLQFSIPFPDLHLNDGTLTVLFHNIRSLHKHHVHVLNDKSYTEVVILIICESWTKPEDDISIPGFVVVHRRDCIKDKRHAYGTVVYAKETVSSQINVFYKEAENNLRNTELHSFIDIVAFSVKSQKEIAIIALHKSPKCTVNAFKNNIKQCFDEVARRGIHDVVVVGDFNLNIQNANVEAQLSTIMSRSDITLAMHMDQCTTNSGTLIDLVYTNVPSVQVNVFESVISDHKPVWFTIPFVQSEVNDSIL